MAKKKVVEEKQWVGRARITQDIDVLVRAATEEEAEEKFNRGEYEEAGFGEITDWELRGRLKEDA